MAFIIMIAGCAKDNYDPPKSFLKGTVVYNGNPVGVRSNATQLELWQYGFALRQKIIVHIAQDGTFSSKLFDGDYKLVRLSGAPWSPQTDSINVTVKGTTTVEVPVTPYFTITGETFSNASGVISASCNVSKIGTSVIERVTLYIGITSIVDANNNATKLDKTGAALSDLSVPLTFSITPAASITAKGYVFARIGVKTSGVSELFYTPVHQITF